MVNKHYPGWVTEQLYRFRHHHDWKSTDGGGRLQEHKMRTLWCTLKRLFGDPKMVEAVVKNVIILIDGWHNKCSKDALCLANTYQEFCKEYCDCWMDQHMRQWNRLLWLLMTNDVLSAVPRSKQQSSVWKYCLYAQGFPLRARNIGCWFVHFSCGLSTVWNEFWKHVVQRRDVQDNKHKKCNK